MWLHWKQTGGTPQTTSQPCVPHGMHDIHDEAHAAPRNSRAVSNVVNFNLQHEEYLELGQNSLESEFSSAHSPAAQRKSSRKSGTTTFAEPPERLAGFSELVLDSSLEPVPSVLLQGVLSSGRSCAQFSAQQLQLSLPSLRLSLFLCLIWLRLNPVLFCQHDATFAAPHNRTPCHLSE